MADAENRIDPGVAMGGGAAVGAALGSIRWPSSTSELALYLMATSP